MPGISQRTRRGTLALTLGTIVLVSAVPVSAASSAGATCGGRPVTVLGTDGVDRISGTPGDDVIDGRGGADVIDGRGGDDTLCGGPGRDTLIGGPGADRLYGGDGADTLVPGGGRDHVSGGPSNFDEVSYASAWQGAVDVDLTAGVATGAGRDMITSVESATGTRFDDRMVATDRAEGGLSGGPGDDTLIGGPRRDALDGGGGDDTLLGKGGWDFLQGERGDDVIRGGDGRDEIQGGYGSDRLYGGADRDQVDGYKGFDRGGGGGGADLCISLEVRSSCEQVH